MIDADDRPIGRILWRREVLALFGGSSAALLAACAPAAGMASVTTGAAATASPATTIGVAVAGPSCVVRQGAELDLTINVAHVQAWSCVAFGGAIVDVWHCDALGVYSDANDAGFNTKGQMFLRGYQTTNARGLAKVTTVYPGWY